MGYRKKYLNSFLMNPRGKPVVLFGPNLTDGAKKDLLDNGAAGVARSLDELQGIVDAL